jgi:hypothetical protein
VREDKENERRRGKLRAISIWLTFEGYISDW